MPPKKIVLSKATAKTQISAKPQITKGAPTKGTLVKKGSSTSVIKSKNPAAGKGKQGGQSKENKPKERVWTKQDDAARKIQTSYRKFHARIVLQRKKKEKEEYDLMMDKLEKEAFIQIVKRQQEESEKQRQAEEEERRRRLEQRKRIKRMLEAAFEGDNDEILTVLREVSELDDKSGVARDDIGKVIRNKHLMALVECEDANENTPLSEAANGGSADTLRMLLDKGANPNTVGQFRRTPLYRAAFAGHLEATQVLLQYGADPRIYGGDGQTPEQVASVAAVQEFLQLWDLSQTDLLLLKLEADQQRRVDDDRKRKDAEKDKLEEQIEVAEKDYKIRKKQVDKAYQELEKRISEHDTAASEGFERLDLTLQTIHDAEADLEIMKIEYEKARDKLAEARMKLREQKKGDELADGSELPGVKVVMRELEDVLLRDVGNKIKDSGKWPMIIDSSGQVSTFLRYRDTNYMNALRPADMENNKVRLALLGAIRFGKPLVLDMMGVDMFNTVAQRMDEIQPGLMSSIMDKSIINDEKYLSLLKSSDGEEYSKTRFNDLRTQSFRFFILTKNQFPPDDLVDKTYLIRVCIPT